MAISMGKVVDVLRAAGEPTRLRILALLAREELAVLELCGVLGQSQPRVSRHLKLLADAGLVERFPDGAWVFYRLAAGGEPGRLVADALALIDPADKVLAADAERLSAVHAEREAGAGDYFARNAARWDEIRSLYVSEADVEAAILAAVGEGPFRKLVDLGSGTGRMLTLLGPYAEGSVGLDRCELRHGDIFGTRLPPASADLLIVHQVLHYLADPAAAVREAGRIVADSGKLIIVDFAPHALEFLREQHQHRRLGFSDAEMKRWLAEAGFANVQAGALPPTQKEGLTVKIWTAERGRDRQRTAA